MTIKSLANSKSVTIATENNDKHIIEICTFLGTTVFKDTIQPVNNTIKINGLNPGKYIIHITNDLKLIKKQINI